MDFNDKIRNILNTKLREKHLSVRAVEQMSGVGSTALRSFLNGKVKTPTLETLHAYCKALDIKLSELIDESPLFSDGLAKSKSDNHLLLEILKQITDVCDEEKLETELEKIFLALADIYKVCKEKGSSSIDRGFIKILLNRI